MTGDGAVNPDARRSGSTSGAVHLGLLATMALSLPVPGSDPWLEAMIRNFVVSSVASVTTAMALFLFGRRKQETDEDEEERRRAEQGRGAGDDLEQLLGTDWEVPPDERDMPRWRRPSLMAARKGAPVPTAEQEAATRLTFDRGIVEPDVHHERRRIRYRMVRLSDAPDEIRSNELGRLDRGDEVELLENVGAYWQVRVPTGQIGWVHRMTLGERIGGPAAAPAAAVGSATQGAVMATVGWAAVSPTGPLEGSVPEPAPPAPRDAFAARLAWQPAVAEDPVAEGLAARLIRERHQH